MLTNNERTVIDLLASCFGIETEQPDVLVEQNLQELGLDSLDSMDFLHRLKEKYNFDLPNDAESNVGKMTVRQLAGFLEPACTS